MTIDFLNATRGHTTILNFSTIPQWMFKTPQPVPYPADPNQVFWNYTQGTELRDPSMKELAGYYARLVSWYTKGGFTDENGTYHHSGYHYSLPYWEIFNEIESEHHTTPQQYTQRYDAIAQAIHSVSPKTKFVGLALISANSVPYLEYFLNRQNHQPGVPLDMISYHFYASPKMGEGAEQWQHTFFNQANNFLAAVKRAESIRLRLSPSTKTTIDELGVILPDDNSPNAYKRITPIYWNAAGALYAYLYVELSKIGIDVAGESQLVGCPLQFPSVSMIDWNNGQPNARFWVLKLLKDNFGPGDSLMSAHWPGSATAKGNVEIQAYKTKHGRKLLLINKRNSPQIIPLRAEWVGSRIEKVDLSTAENPPQSNKVATTELTLSPFEVAVIHVRH
jgi:hypothetical protein